MSTNKEHLYFKYIFGIYLNLGLGEIVKGNFLQICNLKL